MKVSKNKYCIIAVFIASFAFFAFAYPYHLIHREQTTLFLYDLPYIFRTYSGSGCIARLSGDFLEQFYCFRFFGPFVVSLLLTAACVLAYKICRTFAGRKMSFLIALIVYCIYFLRETDTRFLTQYTIASTGYLLCIYAALVFRKPLQKLCALPVALVLGWFLFGSPYHRDYGKLIGKPDFEYEKLIAMDVETYRENWDKVLDISKSKLLYNEACYLNNLADAMKGHLSGRLFTHPQNYANGLFLMVNEVTPFSNGMAGEVWYHLGNMTLADQSAMVSLQFSPKHTGARFVQRLAMINLISEQYGSAEKYLKMLSRTLVYRRWALGMMPDNQSPETRAYLSGMRRNLVAGDIVSGSNDYRHILRALIEANPENAMAREYLLCYYLLTCNLDAFMEEYRPGKDNSNIYQEAAIIWLNIQYNNGTITDVDFDDYGITDDTIERFQKFNRAPERYKTTYWYYYSTVIE